MGRNTGRKGNTGGPPPKPVTAGEVPGTGMDARAVAQVAASANAVTLASLSMLRVRKDVAQQDYVDYLVPFIKHALRATGMAPVTAVDAKALLGREFGLQIPVQAVELVLKRLTRAPHNVLQRLSHQWHVVDPNALLDIEPSRSAALRDIALLIERLIAFAQERYDLAWTEAEASGALTAYLGQFSIECLAAFQRNTALPDVPKVGKETLFVVNTFVDECVKRDAADLERLLVVVKGTMLANALLCKDLDYVQQKFAGVTFYLDTPLVLRLLDLDADPRQGGVLDLIGLLKSLQGRVAVFAHTVDEIRGVLDYYENNISNPTVQHWRIASIRSAGTTGSDIRLLCEKLEETLGEAGIEQEHHVPYNTDYQIDEAILGKVLYDDIPYRNEKGRDFDVNSMRSVYALRAHNRPRRLEDCRAVLVTSNVQLAKTAYEFGRDQEVSREVSSVVTDFTVANLAWLKSPVQHDSLPFMEMAAAAYGALNPSEELWSKVLTVADRLRETGAFSQKDHELLRVSPILQRELMHLTLGSEAAFTPETAQEMLERIKDDLVREQVSRHSEELKAETARLQAERERREAELLAVQQAQEDELARSGAALAEERRRLETQAARNRELLETEQKRHQRIFGIATKLGTTAAVLVAVSLVVVVLGSLVPPVLVARWEPSDARTRALAAGCGFFALVLAAVWGIPSAVWGITVVGLIRAARMRGRGTAFRLLYRMAFGGPPDPGLITELEGKSPNPIP